ncbi:MAG: Structural maintenance of chromosomes protein 1 [Cirrosporium novae-zelandiae]|nr:MAG: Structural maintenance of chromosomes protein 1 [Cirrosporium novae-zelandiae]
MGKLIRLELFNFKSYKGHHTLLFGDSYFTSIIGPNGSGKSNSMDAISFVLGIKSSHLRSSHLRDLIYRGRVLKTATVNEDGSTTEKQANGQASTQEGESQDPKTAWVMAVYEDDAGDEQEWKRTISNQGTSEYRINNRQVTAAQYNEALEAENILIKARNFLVFQGDVEAIASQSPKDLTRLIEQISGSLEFKAEYEKLSGQAEEAAENQAHHLNRRRAINSEIKQYQEQKREAESYARKADERDQAIVTHILWKLFHFQRTIDESTKEIQKHQDELKEYRRSVEKFERSLEKAKKEQAQVGREVSRIDRGIKGKENEIEEKENALIPIDEKIDISNRKLQKLRGRITEISKERDSQSSTIKSLSKDLRTVERAQATWEAEWRRASESEGRQLSEADLQEYNHLKEEVNRRSAENRIRVDNLRRQAKADEETVNSLKSRVDSNQWQVQTLQAEIDKIRERKTAVDETIRSTSREIDSKKKEFNRLTSERLNSSQKRTELEEKLQEVLKKLVEADDGKRQSEREIRIRETIATLKRIFPGVKGRVSELCKPRQKKYSEAVSVVLGRNIDAIVVDNEKTAKDCIQHLRDQRAGQATFIPLETIQTKAINSNLKGMHRGMRMAIDTIDYDSAYERAMSYACGNSIVCDDLDVAKYVCYEKGVEAKAVTLDGTVIHKGGLMTGGRGPGQQNARRWDEPEIAALQKMKDNYLAELARMPKGHRRGTEEETLQGELTGLDQRLAYAREETQAFERNLESKTRELDFAQRQLQEVRPKYNEKQRSLNQLKESIQEIQSSIDNVEDEVFANFCQRLGYHNIREYEVQQGSLQQEASQKKLEFTTQKSKLQHQLNFETERLQATENRISSIEAQIERDEALIEQLEQEKEVLANELDVLNAELEQLKEELEEQQTKYADRAEHVAAQRREVQKRSKNVDGTLKAIAGLEAEIQRTASNRYTILRRCKLEDISIPLTDDSASLDQLPIDVVQGDDPDAMDIDEPDTTTFQTQAISDYGIEVDFEDLEDNLKESGEEKVDEELQEKISTLNADLEKLSPNMRAVERLEGVESRLRTVEKEFEDARRAAKKSRDEFQAVKERRFELFNKAFTHISDQIGNIYRDLTMSTDVPLGGQAYLDIEDSDAPYLAGIKYHAMPPLKRFRDMEHLSGGEKTIAALALLFAVHSYQPSPFFVLDEVDAALDNVNVERVANYIRSHGGPGMQFVVISLKMRLFERSEGLVGVFRDQVAGSSRCITLDVGFDSWVLGADILTRNVVAEIPLK